MKNDASMLDLYKKVYASQKTMKLLRIVDLIAVSIVVIVFAVCAFFAFADAVCCGLKFLLSAAVPFCMVSITRHFTNAKRPYQVYDFLEFTDKNPGNKNGKSFPSRHVFSAFLIAGLAFSTHPVLGIITLIVGGVLAICRVLLGIHFVKDVIFGAIMGAVSSMLGVVVWHFLH